jgi:hypothetical protein
MNIRDSYSTFHDKTSPQLPTPAAPPSNTTRFADVSELPDDIPLSSQLLELIIR